MSRLHRTLAMTAIAVVSLSANAQVTVGTATPGAGNCIPPGCSFGWTRYQQVYTATAFPGVFDIGSFSFFHTVIQPGAGQLAPGTYTFSFANTTNGPGSLSSNYASNISSPLSLFATMVIAPNTPSGSIFTVTGLSPYLFNPALGNLLLDVAYSNTSPQVVTYFDADQSGRVTSRVYGNAPTGIADAIGLVTRFDGVKAVTPTPEPATLVLLGSGLLGVFGVARRKQSRLSLS